MLGLVSGSLYLSVCMQERTSQGLTVCVCVCMAFTLLKMLRIVGVGQFIYSLYVYDERDVMSGQQRHACGIYWLALQ